MQPTLGLPSLVVTASSLTPSRGRACPAAPRRGHVPCASSRVRRSARPVEGAAAPRLLGWSPSLPLPPRKPEAQAELFLFILHERSPFSLTTSPPRVLERKTEMKGNLPSDYGRSFPS